MDSVHRSYRHRLSQRCEHQGLTVSDSQLDSLTQYVALLLHWRRAINLTGLREAEAIIDVLVAESLDFLWREALPPAARVLDLGTGAGVPGVPLAICAPDLDMTLLDRSHKKITFLRRTLAFLQLDHCQAICDSAETLARHLPVSQRFDAVVTRGVGSVAHLLALTGPLLRPGGRLVLRKPQHTAELQEAAKSLASEPWVDVKTIALPQQGRTAWMLLIVSRGLQPMG